MEGARHACYMEKTREFHKGLIEFLSTLKWGMGLRNRRRAKTKENEDNEKKWLGSYLGCWCKARRYQGSNYPKYTFDINEIAWNVVVAFDRLLQMFLLNYLWFYSDSGRSYPVYEQTSVRILICILAFFYMLKSLHEKKSCMFLWYCVFFFSCKVCKDFARKKKVCKVCVKVCVKERLQSSCKDCKYGCYQLHLASSLTGLCT